MDVPLLIDAIVRQTMVLIAQLSTASGYRSPLSHVADRVFLDPVEELERQWLGKKVIADMFGLALRSYQQKVQRLSESATDAGQTLWSAVYEYVRDRGVVTRERALGQGPERRAPLRQGRRHRRQHLHLRARARASPRERGHGHARTTAAGAHRAVGLRRRRKQGQTARRTQLPCDDLPDYHRRSPSSAARRSATRPACASTARSRWRMPPPEPRASTSRPAPTPTSADYRIFNIYAATGALVNAPGCVSDIDATALQLSVVRRTPIPPKLDAGAADAAKD